MYLRIFLSFLSFLFSSPLFFLLKPAFAPFPVFPSSINVSYVLPVVLNNLRVHTSDTRRGVEREGAFCFIII